MGKNYIFAVQWQKKTIGGMAQRFLLVADYISKHRNDVVCISSKSLAKHLGIKKGAWLILINDDSKYRLLNEIVLCIKMLCLALCGRIAHIHFAGGGKIEKILYRLMFVMRVPTSITFASRTLDMASYDNPKVKKEWLSLLRKSKKIDVLNPGYELPGFESKVVVSPCSFPSRLYGGSLEPLKKIEDKVSKNKGLIYFCGSLSKTKNPLLALAAIKKVILKKGQDVKVKFAITGKGVLYTDCQLQMNEINALAGYEVCYWVKEEDIFKTMEKAQIFLSLQDYDNYPSQSLMEAMYFGCSVISTSDGDTSEMFRDTTGNIMLTSKDVNELENAILEILDDCCFNFTNSNKILKTHTLKNFSEYFSKMLL